MVRGGNMYRKRISMIYHLNLASQNMSDNRLEMAKKENEHNSI